MSWYRGVALMALFWLVASTAASPVRRSPGGLEARRRSAIDRSMVRFGRSNPAALTAADVREIFQRPTRRQNSFLRLGRSQPITLTTDDLIALIKSYNNEDFENSVTKRAMDFLRLGRDPKFIRFGRSSDSESNEGLENPTELIVNTTQQRKSRARDHFLRLGRDSEELNEELSEQDQEIGESRKKRSTGSVCNDCHS